MRLHIFEPRYLLMMESVLAGEQRIGIAHLREGYEEDYYGTPPVHRMLTAARLLFADRLPDGRWNVMIEGIERVEIMDIVQEIPFRIARVESCLEEVPVEKRKEINALMNDLSEFASRIGSQLLPGRRELVNVVNTHQHPGIVCDIIASVLVSDSYARQSLLMEHDIHRRLQLLNVQLQGLAAEMRKSGMNVDSPARD